MIPHKILVKLDATVTDRLVRFQRVQHLLSPMSSESPLGELNQRYGVQEIRRAIPTSSRFEQAHRQFGLHRWYEITFDDTLTTEVQQLLIKYRNHPAVAVAEPLYLRSLNEQAAPTTVNTVFTDDPRWAEQWHYYNTGQSGGTPSADINLPAAWAVERGDARVIVAVIDEGVDTRHEDLKDAMWVNTAEQEGIVGVDDDGNGYADDVYGYGFGDDEGRIVADEHGTHVAGTIGAVSDNGVGVAGIAGGSGAGDGVRLMSCAVFGTGGQGGFPAAFVYAADHGAVIAQNSWGGGRESAALEDAIRYFTERAGYDNSNQRFSQNIQTGPMAGGLVVFAAGNGNTTNQQQAYPASLASVLTVAATDHRDQRAEFSNYGPWIDLSAPGTEVLSTAPSDTYQQLSGTSMACPHVSGVAALLVSRYQQPGLRPATVRRLLMASTDPIDALNPRYEGQLGAGRLNAYRALTQDQAIAPGAVTTLTAQTLAHDQVLLQWTASGGDGAEGTAAHYELRYATTPITAQNFDKATEFLINRAPQPSGTPDSTVVHGLTSATTYYFALRTRDLLGKPSPLSEIPLATTLPPPKISRLPASLTLSGKVGETVNSSLTIDNTAGLSELSFSLVVPSENDWLAVDNNAGSVPAGGQTEVSLTIAGDRLPEGTYQSTLTILSNDPAKPRIEVPITITMIGIPQLRVSPRKIGPDSIWLATERQQIPITISNSGSGTLDITRLSTTGTFFQPDTLRLQLPPGARHTLMVNFTPTTVGTFEGVLTLQSNDLQRPAEQISLSVTVVPPPLWTVAPSAITVDLTQGEMIERQLQLNSHTEQVATWTATSTQGVLWWSVTPATGRGGSEPTMLQLTLSAAQLSAGEYRDVIRFQDKAGEATPFLLPVTLRVAEKIVPLSIPTTLPDQRLALSDTTYQINLADYVNHDEAADLRYSATDDAGLIQLRVNGSQLGLTPQQLGTTTVQLTIEDDTQVVQTSFRVTVVVPNRRPTTETLPDTLQLAISAPRTIILSEIFTDADGDPLTYASEVSDSTVLAADLVSGVLTLRGLDFGTATVAITATDPAGTSVTGHWEVQVGTITALNDLPERTLSLAVYPNPATDQISVQYQTVHEESVSIQLYDEYGRLIETLSDRQHRSFEHTLQYSVAKLPAGVYLIRLVSQRGTITRRFVVI